MVGHKSDPRLSTKECRRMFQLRTIIQNVSHKRWPVRCFCRLNARLRYWDTMSSLHGNRSFAHGVTSVNPLHKPVTSSFHHLSDKSTGKCVRIFHSNITLCKLYTECKQVSPFSTKSANKFIRCRNMFDHLTQLSLFSTSNEIQLDKNESDNNVISTNANNKTQNLADLKYRQIYFFNYIVYLRAFSRVKLYQTAFTVLLLPAAIYSYHLNNISQFMLTYISGTAVLALSMLYVVSIYVRKTIGMISVDESGEYIRLSHLTFWGVRAEKYMPLSDIVPLTDVSDDPNDVYVILRRYSTKDSMYFFRKPCKINDEEILRKIIGDTAS